MNLEERSFSPATQYVLISLQKMDSSAPHMDGTAREQSDLFPATHALCIVVQGSAMIHAGSRAIPAHMGTCLFATPGTRLRVQAQGAEAFAMYVLLYGMMGQSAVPMPEGAVAVGDDMLPVLKERLDWLITSDEKDGIDMLNRHILFQQILLLILHEHRDADDKNDWTGSELKKQWMAAKQQEEEDEVERTIAYLHARYADRIQIGQLAQTAHMSRWQYGKLFKSLTGHTPVEYINLLRIQLSKQLLADPAAMRLREIAGRVGFQDEYYFSRRFKQVTGQSPTSYRAKGAKPPRILCLQYLGELITLGIRPAAANRTMISLLCEHASGIVAVNEPLLAEEIHALQPDLILYPSYVPPAVARELRQIAPALEIGWRDDVYTRLKKIGSLFGREEAAEQWIKAYESRAAWWQERIRQRTASEETASAFVFHKGLHVYSGDHFGHTLYRGLGFFAPEHVRQMMEQEPGVKWKRILPESMHEYAGDRIFIAMPSGGRDLLETKELMKSDAWRRLPAVKNGLVHETAMGLANYNPIMLDAQLKVLGRLVLEHERQ